MAKVSVIMWVYNTPEEYLRRAVESVLGQTFGDFCFYIYDDCSTDGTAGVLAGYAAKDSRVTVYRALRNRIQSQDFFQTPALVSGEPRTADSEYTCEIDSDDWYEPDFLELAYGIAKKHNADIVAGNTRVWNEDLTFSREGVFTCAGVAEGSKEVVGFWVKYYEVFRPRWNKLFRSSLYDKFVAEEYPLDVGGSVDCYVVQSILGASSVIAAIGKDTYNYRSRENSVSGTINPWIKLVKKNVVLYYHSLKILDKLGGLNADNVRFMRSVLLSAILRDDISVLERNKDDRRDGVQEYLTETLELMLTDPTVWDVINDFSRLEEYFDKMLGIAAHVLSNNPGNPRVTESFVSRMGGVYARTDDFKNVSESDMREFVSAVYQKENINNAGSLKFKKLFEGFGGKERAAAKLEGFLNDMLAAGDADAAEGVLSAVLNLSVIYDDENLFIETRVRRLELFTLTEQKEKAASELLAVKELCGDEQFAEIKKMFAIK